MEEDPDKKTDKMQHSVLISPVRRERSCSKFKILICLCQFYKTTQKPKDLCKISAIYTEKDKKIQSIDRKKREEEKEQTFKPKLGIL